MTEAEKVAASLTLECPDCGRSMRADREDTDPPLATKAVLQCDRCDDGERHSPEFFGADGLWINPVAHLLKGNPDNGDLA